MHIGAQFAFDTHISSRKRRLVVILIPFFYISRKLEKFTSPFPYGSRLCEFFVVEKLDTGVCWRLQVDFRGMELSTLRSNGTAKVADRILCG